MKKTQEEIAAVKEQLAKITNDPDLTFVCNSFTFCNKCEDWWPCKCPESHGDYLYKSV